MTLMGLTGALMGVAASVASRIGKQAEDHRLTQLENTVNLLERRLGTTESLVGHWRSEARRLAQENRELRIEAQAQGFEDAARRQAAMQAQHYAAMVPADPGQGQLGQLGQSARHEQALMPRSAAALRQAQFSIIRNCSPGRAAVLGGTHGRVKRLDPGEA